MSVELDDMRALAGDQREILVQLEWRWNEGLGDFSCPMCGDLKPIHDDHCELAAVLAFRVADAVSMSKSPPPPIRNRGVTSAQVQLLHVVNAIIESGQDLTLHEVMVGTRLCKQTVQSYFAALVGIGYATKEIANDWSTVSITDAGQVAMVRHKRR